MKDNGEKIPEYQKLCVLTFDEIYISQKIEIERKQEKRVGPHKTVQVGMIRGLFHFWKQLIFYKFDQPLTSDIIKEIIRELYDIGYCVVGLTTDLGLTNNALRKSLNI